MPNLDSTPSLPDPDRDWTPVDFPGAMSLEALVGEEPEDDRLESHPPEPHRSGTDLLGPYWSGERPVRSPIHLPFQREEPNGGGSVLNGDTAALPKGPADVAQLVAVAETLHQENEQLRRQVHRLEAAVTECRATLELQQMRAQTQQALYDARSRDFDTTKQTADRLAKALEAAEAALARRDQERMEWAQQEELDRGRIAQLERSCALLQEQCLKQTDELMRAATTDRELRSRLQRQQRQTLQLRTALEKCLDREYGRSVLPPLGKTEPRSLARNDRSTLEPIDPLDIDLDIDRLLNDASDLNAGAIAAEFSGNFVADDEHSIAAHHDGRNQRDARDWATERSALNTDPIAPTAENSDRTEDDIRAEEILALLNWDLHQQRPAPSYRISAAAGSQRALATDQPAPTQDDSPASPNWASDRVNDADDAAELPDLDLDGLDDLADALWLSDWPRPLSQADRGEPLDHETALTELPEPSRTIAPDVHGQPPEPIDPEPHLAQPLADLLLIEAELMDWSPRSPQPPASTPAPAQSQSQSQWPAPTLSSPRKRRASLAAVELPKF